MPQNVGSACGADLLSNRFSKNMQHFVGVIFVQYKTRWRIHDMCNLDFSLVGITHGLLLLDLGNLERGCRS
jgi:hypothetical protein